MSDQLPRTAKSRVIPSACRNGHRLRLGCDWAQGRSVAPEQKRLPTVTWAATGLEASAWHQRRSGLGLEEVSKLGGVRVLPRRDPVLALLLDLLLHGNIGAPEVADGEHLHPEAGEDVGACAWALIDMGSLYCFPY